MRHNNPDESDVFSLHRIERVWKIHLCEKKTSNGNQ